MSILHVNAKPEPNPNNPVKNEEGLKIYKMSKLAPEHHKIEFNTDKDIRMVVWITKYIAGNNP